MKNKKWKEERKNRRNKKKQKQKAKNKLRREKSLNHRANVRKQMKVAIDNAIKEAYVAAFEKGEKGVNINAIVQETTKNWEPNYFSGKISQD